MNILHLVQDEKFIDFFARTMSLVDRVQHRYVVHTPNSERPLCHIRQVTPFRRIDDAYFSSAAMRDDLAKCDVFVVHFLTPQGAKMIRAAPARIKIVWSGWGADYYHLLPGGQDGLLGSETREIARSLDFRRAGTNPISHARLFFRPVRRFYDRRFHLASAIERVNFFSSPIPEDYLLLKTYLGNKFSPSYIQLNYGSVEETFATKKFIGEKRNILVGNSAHLTNNQIEIFRMLANHDLSNRKVIVPLSYGDSDYKNIILDYGQKILGSHFQPVIEFLPLTEYNKLISTCSCAIMNSHRQQALGNIGSVLYGGAKLFLNSRNVTSNFFKERDAHISDVQELKHTDDVIFSELTNQQKTKNIQVLNDFWGKAKIKANAIEFIKIVGN